jgi:PAS domain S-box-containing protein
MEDNNKTNKQLIRELANLRLKYAELGKETGRINSDDDFTLVSDKLSSSEKHNALAAAQKIAHLGSWEWNIRDNSETWSDEQFRIFGYEPGKVKPSYDLFVKSIHPDDRDRVLKAVENVLAGDEPYMIEFRIIRPDKTERSILAQGEVYRDVENSPVRMLGTSLDITERKKYEEQLKQMEEELRWNKNDLESLAGHLIVRKENELSGLARELHDDITQRLAVLAIEAGSIEKDFKELPGPVLEKVARIKEQLIKLSKNIHDISRDIHPSILDDLGLERAIQSECGDFSSRTGIAVIFTPKNIPRNISKEISLPVYRIIQEGLANIVKHADTKNAYVFLEGSDDRLILTVRDTGVGFDHKKVRKMATLGLGGIRERARLIDGKSSITSNPGKGTTIEVSIPYKRRDA